MDKNELSELLEKIGTTIMSLAVVGAILIFIYYGYKRTNKPKSKYEILIEKAEKRYNTKWDLDLLPSSYEYSNFADGQMNLDSLYSVYHIAKRPEVFDIDTENNIHVVTFLFRDDCDLYLKIPVLEEDLPYYSDSKNKFTLIVKLDVLQFNHDSSFFKGKGHIVELIKRI